MELDTWDSGSGYCGQWLQISESSASGWWSTLTEKINS